VALEQQKRLIVLRHRIVSVLKIIVLVPMVMQPQAQHVLPMVITFVRLVTVTITKLATHALDALRVALAQQKRLLAHKAPTARVLQTFVLVPMALKQRAHYVPPMVLTFVRRVTVDITKLATHALDALRVALEKDKRLLVLRHRIVFVLKTFVRVPMVLLQPVKRVPTTVIIFVRPVTTVTQKTLRVWT